MNGRKPAWTETGTEAGEEGKREKERASRIRVWVDDPGSRQQKVIRRHGPAVTSSSVMVGGRAVAQWGKVSPKGRGDSER